MQVGVQQGTNISSGIFLVVVLLILILLFTFAIQFYRKENFFKDGKS
jgi:Tfp pilus assembly protein PilX